ncbi:IS66 family insertion sequence element accessory protein TnpB [sulfur-oxidizing endosymbiont of Gigantopelta aegis]|uniref:IS66 family insertion sequence element accessory protein TnpB n=1 Tax=sulfur-oxidizing endosymbiont of Gigantopelta aegis TaxID=2794934 RepID=UPI0018DC22E5|nr:IS66 family insertion sequence element accessory protein TnpB [sulfur-oxidizing endosymbiont of Gigantopelta aegis]
MITGITVNQVYLVSGVTDMRKATNGLSLIVSEQLEHNPFDGSVFVFCNRQRDKLKILYWERNGFWLYYRTLEKGNSSGRWKKNNPLFR